MNSFFPHTKPTPLSKEIRCTSLTSSTPPTLGQSWHATPAHVITYSLCTPSYGSAATAPCQHVPGFLACLSDFCPPEIAGQSMRAGGTTALAEAGTPGELIWGAGHWSSDAFEQYICKNVIVLHALILGRSLHYSCEP